MSSHAFRRTFAVVLLLIAAGAAFVVVRGGDVKRATARACPPGYMRADKDLVDRYLGSKAVSEDEGGISSQYCMSASHPETAEDITKFGDNLARHAGGERPGQLRAALHQKAKLADDSNVPGANGTWRPLGKGPLVSDDPKYAYTYGDAFGKLAGRISDYAYDARTNRLWATVAQGGVWESDDRGKNWYALSGGPNGLPVPSAGGLAWTPAGGDGGTLIVATGDHAFSNDYSGLGIYYTTDSGRHWTHAKGVPDGALSFQIAVDPTRPNRVYAATGVGLFRSDDAGRNWQNVNLPTGDCAGDSFKPNCFFANVVTSVVVQPPDEFKHTGGKVAAAVGWRAGDYLNFNKQPQAPNNGLYTSDSGDTGSFKKAGAGLPDVHDFGRAELGTVGSSKQNSEFLYAIVQSTKAFTSNSDPDFDNVPADFHCDPVIALACIDSGSVLDGIYVSNDFGQNWTLMEDRKQITNDTANGSAINQLRPLGFSAGYQVTYNEWIKVDPTQQDSNGTPTHLLFGMEELWQNSVAGQPMDGPTRFEAFGPYSQSGACVITIAAQSCGASQQVSPQGYTTHPDQHGGLLLPGAKGGVDLFAGNDGGDYRIHSDSGQFSRSDIADGNQKGFYTLLPYHAVMAKDGTVYAGLQDNGEMRIDPKTQVQNEVYVGDAVFNVVNPDESDEVIEEYPTARLSASEDGGVNWTDIAPNVEDADFVSPVVQDPTNYKHITTGGRQIVESTAWTKSTYNGCKREPDQDTHPNDPINGCEPAETDWTPVFDLGTFQHPGDPKAGRDPAGDELNDSKSTPEDPVNVDVAQALYGAAHYVGFCGSCDPVKLHEPFHTGIATNVGGDKPAKVASPDGWHIAKASGLPNRFITSITIDPKDVNTIYVTLGSSGARPFAPVGSLGEETESAKGGYVYVSHDHGESFSDLTGDLPKVQTNWIRLKGDQLVVANAIGMFISKELSGKHWAPLGSGFPTSPVYSFEFEPANPEKIVVASYGRGVWEYDFTPRKGPAVLGAEFAGQARPCNDNTGPTSRFMRNIKSAAHRKGKNLLLRGTAAYKQCKGAPTGKVKRVVVQLRLQVSKKKCRWLTKKGRLGKTVSCKRKAPAFLKAKGTSKWAFTVKGPLPAGKYVAYVTAKDDLGNTERRSAHRNFRHFRIRGKAVLAGWHGKQKNTVG